MIAYILSDFSRVILMPKDRSYAGELNDLYRTKVLQDGMGYFDVFDLNEELLAFLGSLGENYPLGIFTSEIVQNDPAVRPRLEQAFRDVVSAQDLGIRKTEKEAYLTVAKSLQQEPAAVLYIDDKEENVAAARDAGLHAIRYVSNSQIMADIRAALAGKNEKEAR